MFLETKKVKTELNFKKVHKVKEIQRHIDQINREICKRVEQRDKELARVLETMEDNPFK